jgi:hypothetical protein
MFTRLTIFSGKLISKGYLQYLLLLLILFMTFRLVDARPFSLPMNSFRHSMVIKGFKKIHPKHTLTKSFVPIQIKSITQGESKFRPVRFAIVSTGVIGTTVGVFLYFQNIWWAGEIGNFHLDQGADRVYSLNLDKCGHFWSSKIASDVIGDMMQWTGVKPTTALWMGAGFGILTSGIVEIKDGLAPYWGFSIGDMTANSLGAFFPVAQHYCRPLRHFSVKWSYDFQNPSYYKTLDGNHNKAFMDDYERHNYWLSANVHGLLPMPLKPYWPKFLNLALGLSAQHLTGKGGGTHELFLALDYDLTKIPIKSPTLRRVFHYLNNLHFPAPTIRISPQFRIYGMNF